MRTCLRMQGIAMLAILAGAICSLVGPVSAQDVPSGVYLYRIETAKGSVISSHCGGAVKRAS